MHIDNDYKLLINRYIKAKDSNKPHLMKSVFSANAVLEIKVNSDNISFPPIVTGCKQITETLITEFSQSYENVYTICVADTVQLSSGTLNCRWLVGMTETSSGLQKVGFGDYLWVFDHTNDKLVSQLTIIIDSMVILPSERQSELMPWLDSLPAPWALSSEVLPSMPNIAELSDVRDKLIPNEFS